MTRYTLLFVALALTSGGAAADWADKRKEREYLNEIRTLIQKECRGSRNYAQCRSEHSPSKCKPLAFNEDLSAWARCVRSCAHAGFLSRTVGECS